MTSALPATIKYILWFDEPGPDPLHAELLHPFLHNQSQLSLPSLHGQSQLSLPSLHGQSQLSLPSLHGQSQLSLPSLHGQSQLSLPSFSLLILSLLYMLLCFNSCQTKGSSPSYQHSNLYRCINSLATLYKSYMLWLNYLKFEWHNKTLVYFPNNPPNPQHLCPSSRRTLPGKQKNSLEACGIRNRFRMKGRGQSRNRGHRISSYMLRVFHNFVRVFRESYALKPTW